MPKSDINFYIAWKTNCEDEAELLQARKLMEATNKAAKIFECKLSQVVVIPAQPELARKFNVSKVLERS